MSSTPKPPLNKNIADLFAVSASRYSVAPALACLKKDTLNYSELNQLIGSVNEQFKQHSIPNTAKIAIILPQGDVLASACLCLMSCAICVPLNPEYSNTELNQLADDIGIDYLITSADLSEKYRPFITKQSISLITIEDSNSKTGLFTLTIKQKNNATKAKDTSNTALILHTSGSTAKPKIVPLTHSQLLASTANVTLSLELDNHDCALNMMPLFHVGALVDLLLAPLSQGGQVIIATNSSAETFKLNVAQFKLTWFQAVPTMLQSIVDDMKNQQVHNLSKLRFIRSVSSALPNRLLHATEALFNTKVIEIYGMTETGGLICSNPLTEGLQKHGAVGIAFGAEIRIANTKGQALAENTRGEIYIRGSNVMSGYQSSKQAEAKSLNKQHFYKDWFKSGDEGYVDEQGYLFLVGRIKEIINRGGEKISPLEVDQVANLFPSVKQAACFSISHKTLGEDIAIALMLDPKQHFDETEFYQFLQQHLSTFKIPRKIHIVESLPRTIGGKLQRHRLAEHINANKTSLKVTQTKPETVVQKQIAEIWCDILALKNSYLEDNFFDLGGDSLKAATLMLKLEQQFNIDLPMSVLYQSPSIAALEKQLISKQPMLSIQHLKIPQSMYENLNGFLSAWPGQRLNEDSLIVGKHCNGQKPPLFWCFNSGEDFQSLTQQLDDNQPIYAMRSLYLCDEKSNLNNQLLAHHYVLEILQLQAKGPYFIGGFCEAGKIAFYIAKELSLLGHKVASLMLHDQFVTENYSQRVALFISSAGPSNPYYKYNNAANGWRKYVSGELVLYKLNVRHHHVYEQPAIHFLAQQIQHEMRLSQIGNTATETSKLNQLQQFDESSYQVKLSHEISSTLAIFHHVDIAITVTNLSTISWLATAKSGLYLGAKWDNLKNKTRIWNAGYAKLETTLHPGQSTIITMRLKTPWRYRRRILIIDMVDDGIAWFNDKKQNQCHKTITFSLWKKIKTWL